ncbi:MAG: asparagine synthase-related protein [Candidatus Micrarchaeota archaeon]
MCGITAVFGTYKDKEGFLHDSLDKIKHRGTNHFELRVFEEAGIGANRLPIVDRAQGQQPLPNEDNTVYAVQNGEIFNHKELRRSLEEKGHRFKTDCDTEVLAHLYEEYGPGMIQHIDSEMYAFVVYDAKKDDFFVARDRFGVKPLFYAKNGDGYYFASELKQLVQFDSIKEVHTFPKGHYMHNGKLKRYYELKYSNTVKDESYAKRELTRLIVEAVRKRVDTDLPVAVLLSGGVDSSLIMEIASRFHKDVTAFILGKPGSPDYEAAIKLCGDNNYKYHVVYPDVDYAEEFENLIYHLELYEAQVIRQSFALDILSKAVVRAGYRIALVGEAADELFAGYNQFSSLKDDNINKGCLLMTNDMERGHNVRVDRTSMKHTLETRAPLFDTKVVDFVLKIDGKLKIKRENHQVLTKYILRKVAEEFLPDYIAWRYKIAFSNGAGMDVGFNYRAQDGEVAKSVLSKRKATKLDKNTVNRYGLMTEEEVIYFQTYKTFKFDKLHEAWRRTVNKENLTQIDENPEETRLLVAEFGRLPIYFPIYLASLHGIYKTHKLDVEFISTGGDDLTYNSLLNCSAQIGVADPIFTFTEKKFSIKGKIIGQLIGKVPVVAVTINPNIGIEKLTDFENYKIGTFQEYSTTNTLMKELFPNKELIPIKYLDTIPSLKNRRFDIAIVTPGYAYDLVDKGGHIIYRFDKKFGDYLFTGISISDNLDPKYDQAIRSFLVAVKESINFIKKNKKESLEYFKKEFPELLNQEGLFEYLIPFWNKKLTVSEPALKRATHTWRTVYPWLLKSNIPQFIKPRIEDRIIRLFSNRNVSRDIPYKEDEMAQIIHKSIDAGKPISLVGLWGASDKDNIDEKDISALNKFRELDSEIKRIYKPGPEFIFILADEHARLNGYPKSNYTRYLNRIKEKMDGYGFKSIFLNELWKKHGLSNKSIFTEFKKLTDSEWRDIPNHGELEKASKHRGFKNHREEAKRYFIMRRLESRAIEKEFNSSIYHTYSEDIHQNIYPNIPTLYLWVEKRGYTITPWFEN